MSSAHEGRTALFTALFVRRPILAGVINALIVVAGLAALNGVEVRELPDVDRPVVTVTTSYSGASSQTMEQEVTKIVEGAVARVPGLKSMSSQSSYGRSRVTLEFSDKTDVNVASTDVRDAIGRVRNAMPDEIDEPQIVKTDADSDAIMRLAVTSTTLGQDDLTALVEDQISDRLAAVDGVADVQTYGEQEKIFRVDVDQAALASRGLTIANLASALSSVALDVPAGSITSSTQDIIVRATATVETPDAFERLLISPNVRLGDVATVTLGPDTNSTSLRSNGRTGIGLGIIRQAQSNTLSISNGVKAAVADLQKVLPEGTELKITSDDAVFIQGSINGVVRALIEAALIVVAVIFLFLRDWRATLIPAVTMPVALIGTVAAVYLAGFSINILTLLAVVLATGMVVDDAIVVLENIVRRRSEGMGARAAAVLGTQEVFFAVVATTLTLAAVFVPLSFLPGQVGGLFREFGFVLAFAVLLSAIVALTLCPVLASRLPAMDEKAHEAGMLGRFGTRFAAFYRRTLNACLNAPAIVIAVCVVFSLAAFGTFMGVKSELMPREDRSTVIIRVSAPQGVSLDFTRDRMQRIEENLSPLVKSGEVRNVFSISGMNNSSNSGFMVLTLAPWGERERSQDAIVRDVQQAANRVPALRATVMQPNSLRIRGAGSGLQVALVGGNSAALQAAADKLVQALDETGRFDAPRLNNDATQAQVSVNIDRERASDLGINIDGLSQALQSLLEGRSIGDVFVNGKALPVKLMSQTRPIDDPTDLENIFLKAGDGRIVPISVIATLTEKSVVPTLSREQQLSSVAISAGLKDGMALGTALTQVEAIAAPLLPPGARIIPLAEAATLQENSSGMALTFAFALVIIFLVLAAQFESPLSALTIMATVPLGLACAVFALAFTGSSLNIYSQIGLVLLVGVMAKNGILIVEFANQLRDHGHDVRRAIEEASNIRLRPVMMTMICTILGAVPLIYAHGAGAEARIALGWVLVGGLGLATIVTLYLTPVAYLLIARFSKPRIHEEERLQQELDAAHAPKTAAE
ncbi:MAG: efflux RND transporter permease subunit [Proteobacteria bacterium]|nr:efflux RND transporter permease subunit [Pseudomonadota bacterium]